MFETDAVLSRQRFRGPGSIMGGMFMIQAEKLLQRTFYIVLILSLLCVSCCVQAEDSLLPPGITAEMLDASFFLTGDDALFALPEDVERFNETNKHLLCGTACLWELPDVIEGEWILTEMAVRDIPGNLGFIDGAPLTEAYWNDCIAKANWDALPEQITPQYGFSVTRASLRRLPSADFIGETETDRFYDCMVTSEFLPYNPLIKIHESTDGEWYYVLMYGYAGWVQKEYVALCSDKAEWLSQLQPESFLVVTGRELRLQDDPYAEALSGQLLPMGTVLPLVSGDQIPASVSGRIPYGNYIVRLPYRLEDGSAGYALAAIPCSDDVNVGFLPCTRDLVLRQAFKYLGARYGWAGLDHAQDCSGLVRDVYACFGYVLPRGAGAQMKVEGETYIPMDGMRDEEKLQCLDTLPAGSLVYFPGHVMLWLKDNIVLSSVGTFLTEKEGAALQVVTVTLNDLTKTYRRNGNTWLTNLTGALVIGTDMPDIASR